MNARILISGARFALPSCLSQYRRNFFECGEHNRSSYSSPVAFEPFTFTQSALFGLLPFFKSGYGAF
jgi:hypothetical protein